MKICDKCKASKPKLESSIRSYLVGIGECYDPENQADERNRDLRFQLEFCDECRNQLRGQITIMLEKFLDRYLAK
jgi:hypothetical protein